MTIIRFSLWVLVFIFFIYLCFLLYQRRTIYKTIQHQNEGNIKVENQGAVKNSTVESMSTNTDVSIVQNYMKKTATKIQSLTSNTPVINLNLSQVCIKGSYNSAYSGSSLSSNGYISFAALQYVLNRGCRFIDFEVYNNSGVPTVGYFSSSQHTNPDCLFTTPAMSLNSAIQYCITNGLNQQAASATLGTTYSVPNYKDPLFIQIRLNQGCQDKTGLMSLIGKVIQSNYANNPNAISSYDNSLNNIITSITPISNMMNNIIFIFENEHDVYTTNNSFYDGFLPNINVLYVNSTNTKTPIINTIFFSQIPAASSSGGVAATSSSSPPNTIYIVSPDRNVASTQNVSFASAVQNKYQNTLMQFYIPDSGNNPVNQQYLTYYENVFDNFGFAIVPFTNVNTYVYSH